MHSRDDPMAALALEAAALAGGSPGGPPSRYRLFPDRRAQSAEQRSLRRDLAAATAEGNFLLRFQPRAPLRPAHPPGAEALVRWPHRRRGLMSPASFLPLAEQTGHSVEIGGWALRQACRLARAWDTTRVSVHVCARQLTEGVLAGQVNVALAESGLDPELLGLELTEATLADPDTEAILLLSAVRDLGVGVAVAEFGAEIGALATLRRLPLTAVKLDRSLVRRLPDDPEDAATIGAVVTIARAVGLRVGAEGVDTAAQREILLQAGCDEAQGSLFGQPVPAERLPAALAAASGGG